MTGEFHKIKICTSEKRKFKSKQRRSAIRIERRGDASKEGQAHGNRGIDEGLPEWIRELEGDAEGADDESRRSWKGCGGGGTAKGEGRRQRCEGGGALRRVQGGDEAALKDAKKR